MKSFKRSQRVADQIRRDASDVINAMLQDRAGLLVTVSGVEVTDDLRNAKIYYTVLGDEAARDQVRDIFDRSAGYIQSELAHRLRLRRMPEILLQYDKSLIEGMRVTSLIDELTSKPDTEDVEEDQTGDNQ